VIKLGDNGRGICSVTKQRVRKQAIVGRIRGERGTRRRNIWRTISYGKGDKKDELK
jgi:hypothetical protein